MNMMKLIVSALALGAATPALAFDKADEVVELLQLRDALDKLFDGLAPMMASATVAQLSDGKLTVVSELIKNGRGGRDRLTAIVSEEMLAELRKNYPEFLAAAAQQYREAMSEAELDAVLAFYRSPAGAKLLQQQTAMENSMGKLGERIGMKAGSIALPRALERAEREMTR